MAEDMRKAKEVYNTMCDMLDRKGWKYDKVEDELTIKSGVKGDDFPVEFFMRVNPRNEVVSFISFLPFDIAEDKRVDLAIAICAANYGMVDGSFDYDLTAGEIRYRLTSSSRESELSPAVCVYMMMVAASTVDNYNDRFFMLSKGMITIQQFIEQEGN